MEAAAPAIPVFRRDALAQSEQQQFRALHGLVEGLAEVPTRLGVVEAARRRIMEIAPPDDAAALVGIDVRGDVNQAGQKGDNIILQQTSPDDGVRRLAQHLGRTPSPHSAHRRTDGEKSPTRSGAQKEEMRCVEQTSARFTRSSVRLTDARASVDGD
ncbi:MAG: hypothetical protein H6Q85_1938, partial [candidate division NC10 bacterium]|nr:hypothetical protein [candidate division NC10 bacterium]